MNASTRPGRLRRSLGLTAASAMFVAALPAGFAAAQDAPPEPYDTSSVCDGEYDSDFDDVSDDNVHQENILCAADYEITLGKTETTYAPRDDVRRDQMASFVARFIETSTGEELPRGEEGRFEDVSEDNVHIENIDKLAEAGVVLGRTSTTYQPADDIDRDQMAALIRRALSFIDDGDAGNDSAPPESDSAFFEDVPATNVHSDDIAALAEQGIVVGTDEGEYSPKANVRRDQMASFIMRGFAWAQDNGLFSTTLESAVFMSATDTADTAALGTTGDTVTLTFSAALDTSDTGEVTVEVGEDTATLDCDADEIACVVVGDTLTMTLIDDLEDPIANFADGTVVDIDDVFDLDGELVMVLAGGVDIDLFVDVDNGDNGDNG